MIAARGDQGAVRTALAVGSAALLLLPVLLLAAASGMAGPQASACAPPPPTAEATATIPARYLTLYKDAGQRYGIAWEILAAIGEIESGHGRSDLPGVHSGSNSAGAAGPMQFGIGGAAGNTWGGPPVHPASLHTAGYGTDGDHDGVVSVYDPGDAIPAAAQYLIANGAPGNIKAALFAYNHSWQYVNMALTWAARYASGGTVAVTAASSPACQHASSLALPAGLAGKVIAYAEDQLGKPYAWGGTGPDAFDCSGLAMMSYRAAGITIPRTSQQQWAYGKHVPAGQVRPGDLVFFTGADGTITAPGHVGIVLAGGLMIDAPTTGQDVQVQPYNQPDLVGFTDPDHVG